jgi:hypothetical protein
LEPKTIKEDFTPVILRAEKTTQEFLDNHFKGKPHLTSLQKVAALNRKIVLDWKAKLQARQILMSISGNLTNSIIQRKKYLIPYLMPVWSILYILLHQAV